MNLCKDCKHYVKLKRRGIFSPPVFPPIGIHGCKHPELVNRVTGEPEDAESLRNGLNRCGMDAKYFEGT